MVMKRTHTNVLLQHHRLCSKQHTQTRSVLSLPQLHLILTQMAHVSRNLGNLGEITSARQACGIHLPKRSLQGERTFELY
jgi:hypothetical protein